MSSINPKLSFLLLYWQGCAASLLCSTWTPFQTVETLHQYTYYCVCLVSIWWRKYWTINNRLRLPPKPRSQPKDCGRSNTLIQPTEADPTNSYISLVTVTVEEDQINSPTCSPGALFDNCKDTLTLSRVIKFFPTYSPKIPRWPFESLNTQKHPRFKADKITSDTFFPAGSNLLFPMPLV